MGRDLSQHALDGNHLSKALIEATERQLFELVEGRQTQPAGTHSALSSAINTIDRAFNARDVYTAFPVSSYLFLGCFYAWILKGASVPVDG